MPSQPSLDTPRVLKIHADDNVAIVLNDGGLPAGAVLCGGLRLAEAVPQGHKVALVPFAAGAPIRRYGQVIGTAIRAVPAGSWIEASLVQLPAAPTLDSLALATAVPPPLEPLPGYSFAGYRNADGTVGTRNLLAIGTSVQCVAGVVEVALKRIREQLLPRFANVDGVVALTHSYGCGVAIDAPGAAVPIRTLSNLLRNPNFGGAPLVVGLGCEKLAPERLLAPAERPPGGIGDAPGIVRLQDPSRQGFAAMVEAIVAAAAGQLELLNRRRRVLCPAADLVVGVQCGGSDAFSGVTANPVVGFASDLFVRAGATVMFSEVTEVRDALGLLTPRAASVDIARALVREMACYDAYLAQGGADRAANTTPGNKQGGLANIVEKALGSVAKAGTSAISDVLAPGERVRGKGLVFAATPASDFICGTLQLAAGMTLHVFTTGRGTPYGLAAVPVVKLSSRSDLARRWPDLIDLDAGRVATGEASIAELGWELFHLLLEIASGSKRSWAEHWGLANDLVLFNPGPVT